MYSKYFKRLLDIIVSTILLVTFLPLMVILAVVMFFVIKESPFFFQLRSGKKLKTFKVIKFKSMNSGVDSFGKLLPDGLRLTKIGRFLRKYSVDETPQLINVLKGDMSLIGPRPLLVKYNDFYRVNELIRFDVRPGMTGLVQVSGRNNLGWDERLNLDEEYVKNLSFEEDLKILYKSVLVVMASKGVQIDTSKLMLDLDEERSVQDRGI